MLFFLQLCTLTNTFLESLGRTQYVHVCSHICFHVLMHLSMLRSTTQIWMLCMPLWQHASKMHICIPLCIHASLCACTYAFTEGLQENIWRCKLVCRLDCWTADMPVQVVNRLKRDKHGCMEVHRCAWLPVWPPGCAWINQPKPWKNLAVSFWLQSWRSINFSLKTCCCLCRDDQSKNVKLLAWNYLCLLRQRNSDRPRWAIFKFEYRCEFEATLKIA